MGGEENGVRKEWVERSGVGEEEWSRWRGEWVEKRVE